MFRTYAWSRVLSTAIKPRPSRKCQIKRSAGGVNARGPCGTHGRSAAESVDAAEHRMKIHPRWASDLPATRRRNVTPDRPRHHRVILQRTTGRESWRIARRIVACIWYRILSRLFVTLASANHRAISDTQPGRERPPNRPWGQGPGSRGGVAHVPAALRDGGRVGRNRRRDERRIARRCVGKR